MDDFEKRWQRIQQLLGAEARGDAPASFSSQKTLFGIPSHVEQVMSKVAQEDEERCMAHIRAEMRERGIAVREEIPPAERAAKSGRICERLAASEAFARADTIMMYRSVRAEVSLDSVIEAAQSAAKRVAFPVCVDKETMLAVIPGPAHDKEKGPSPWRSGSFGILEPDPDRGGVLDPPEIDLVVCPATAFDRECNRIGMGGGYYDRFLPGCSHATKVLVAFEAQRVGSIPRASWDVPLDAAVTEERIYQRSLD